MIITKKRFSEEIEKARNEVHQQYYIDRQLADMQTQIFNLEKKIFELESKIGEPEVNKAELTKRG